MAERGHQHPGRMIEADAVDCMVALPGQLFYSTQIPACLWFLVKEKTKRKGEVLFIDARKQGTMISRVQAELTDNAIAVLGNFDPYTPKMADGLNISKLIIGEDVRAADLELPGGFANFDLVTKSGRVPVSLQQLGEHQIPNALAAATAAFALGVSNEKIADGLTTAIVTSKWRMEISEFNDLTIINDF